jgi:signal transduction histidine kinase
MRDRLRPIGGHLKIRSSSQGTTLEVIVPVHAEKPGPPLPPGSPVTDS